MLFNSVHFFFFFIIVTLGYWSLGWTGRWRLLLFASCYFYMIFKPVYILILFFTIIIDYYAGIWLEKTEGKQRKWLLIISIISNVGILAFFKYYQFAFENISHIIGFWQVKNPLPFFDFILPIGLSFHTFQAMSYTIEVYRGNQKAEKHFGIYALYVMFYPQLVAGPIERPQNVLPQFHKTHVYDFEKMKSGLMMMAWGLFKKVVIADRLSMLVDYAYENPYEKTGLTLLAATFFYTFQIYCDFSGYSDIALGSAKVMGYDLMENFRTPYFSTSISEFWRRWHISLSTWFRDYLYIPLGGNRVSKWRREYNLFIVFLVSGIWHGASWTFVIWGAIHGFYLIFANLTVNFRNKIVELIGINKLPFLYKIIQISIIFCLTSFAWIFFRASKIQEATYIAGNLFSGIDEQLQQLGNKEFIEKNIFLGKGITKFAMVAFSIMVMEIVHLQQRGRSLRNTLNQRPLLIRWVLYYGIILAILFLGMYDEPAQFIYFQF